MRNFSDNNDKTHSSKVKSDASSDDADNSFREFVKNSENFKIYDDNHRYNPQDDKKTTLSEKIQAPSLKRGSHPPEDSRVTQFQLSEHLWRPLIGADDYLFCFQHGVQNKTIRKLRAGKMRIEASLDLHQMNKDQARIALSNFIGECYHLEKRCIQIIHGKGTRSGSNTPILKNLVNHWLHDIDIVLGFCSCPDNMGGTGAVLILLQRNSD